MFFIADSTEESTAIRTDLGAIFISMELSRSKWLITSLSPGNGAKMSKHVVLAGNVAGPVERFVQLRRKTQARTGRRFPIIVIQEAGLDGFWIHRVLQAEGIESYVVDPASIATSRRRRRAKTDRLDGETLLRTLLAYKRGEPRICAMVQAPSREEEDRRRITRERKTLIHAYLAFPAAKLVRKIGRLPSQNFQTLAQSARNHVVTSFRWHSDSGFVGRPGSCRDMMRGKEHQRRRRGPTVPTGRLGHVEQSRQQRLQRAPAFPLVCQKFDFRMRRRRNGFDASHYVHGKLPGIPDGCPPLGGAGSIFSDFRSPFRRRPALPGQALPSSAFQPPSPRW